MWKKSMKIWFSLMVTECLFPKKHFFHGVQNCKGSLQGVVTLKYNFQGIPLPNRHSQYPSSISRLYLFVFFVSGGHVVVLSISFQKR